LQDEVIFTSYKRASVNFTDPPSCDFVFNALLTSIAELITDKKHSAIALKKF
jgi:hypothetical protein